MESSNFVLVLSVWGVPRGLGPEIQWSEFLKFLTKPWLRGFAAI